MTEKEQPELGYFRDGKGPKSKSTPAEFPSDWHYQAEIEARERALAGALHRLEEVKVMSAALPAVVAEAESAVEAARAKVKEYGPGQKAAAKRPRASAKETRKK